MRRSSSCWSLLLLLLALALPLVVRAQETYISPVFQVTLQYPAGWHHGEGYEEKYGGADGFFQLSALDGRDGHRGGFETCPYTATAEYCRDCKSVLSLSRSRLSRLLYFW